ncbi:hypothetical protein [Amycolatopsis cihanbeyliensis]|uniref:Uncharacterized protein n=1 Tax=Amycolatopsis cihanbeyliensis TaxID=1128664 RepID=A0A542DJ10_AMYCI|nr:hypothetical protein [Amycolatopsis cihanbeyliensis]TQJ03082.1 hypothetical protein FB471_2832 [Amycolatopsis cihanbeyliensis]
MRDGIRTGRQTYPVRVDDVLCAELLDDEMVDRDHLRQALREPRQYLRHVPARSSAGERPSEQPPVRPESTLARRSKLTALVLAGALLSGSVVTASLLADDRETPRPDRLEITGPAALGGFAMPESGRTGSVGGSGGGPGPETSTATTTARATQRSDPASSTDTGATEAQPTAQPEATTTAQASPRADRVALVEEFYQRVRENPVDALALLDPLLTGDQPDTLVRAWNSMGSLTVESLRTLADGSVRAVITVPQPGGQRLRIIQLLEFTTGATPLISQATLLSAQHA